MPSEAIERALVHIQASLDRAPSLDELAEVAGISSFHFHRRFRDEIGETPKAYATRLRLERAERRLLLHDDTVLEVALDCGYANHETFSRAFRRHVGLSPREFRGRGRAGASASGGRRRSSPLGRDRYRLSGTAIRRLRPLTLACIRHRGPYELVDDALYDRLFDWAEAHEPGRPRTFVGIGYDSPSDTPPEALRYDAGVVIEGEPELVGEIERRIHPGGTFAVTTHVGPFASLPAAYGELFGRLSKLEGVAVQWLPVIEIYRTTRVDAEASLNHTDIYVPVQPR